MKHCHHIIIGLIKMQIWRTQIRIMDTHREYPHKETCVKITNTKLISYNDKGTLTGQQKSCRNKKKTMIILV